MSSLGPIKFLTIHCAATPEGKPFSGKQIEAMDIARPDIGRPAYHLIVLLDGAIHRSYPDDVKGAHVAKANTGNIGVCYVGGVAADGKTPKDTRTRAQKVALRTLIRTYRARYPGIVVRGHRDWPGVAKACPSFDVGAWLAEGMPA